MHLLSSVKISKLESELRMLFELVLATARATLYLNDSEIQRILKIASGIYKCHDSMIQKMIFEFMKKLISTFAEEDPSDTRGPIITKLLTFYPEVVFRFSRRSELHSKASQHAAVLSSFNHANRIFALEAFEMGSFAELPLRRFKRRALENLLCVVSRKLKIDISCDIDLLDSVPGILCFLSDVCRLDNSCSFVILVCSVVQQLLEVISKNKGTEYFAMLRSSNILQWVISHVTFPKRDRSCWEPVARLMKGAFKYADAPTKNLLVDLGFFQRILDMFQDPRDEVLCQVLGVIAAVCSGPDVLFINQALNSNVIQLVLPFVEHAPHITGIRAEASKAFDTFLREATSDQLLRAANEGIVAELVRLIASKNERAVTDVLRWLYILFERMEAALDPSILPKLQELVLLSRGDEKLLSLSTHSSLLISRSAAIVYRRYLEPDKRKTSADKALLREENLFFRDFTFLQDDERIPTAM